MNVFGNINSVPDHVPSGGSPRVRNSGEKTTAKVRAGNSSSNGSTRTSASRGEASPRPQSRSTGSTNQIAKDYDVVAKAIESNDSRAVAHAVAMLVQDLDGFRRSHAPVSEPKNDSSDDDSGGSFESRPFTWPEEPVDPNGVVSQLDVTV